ncbi:hypothetical protein DL765_004734 [Monosporascus sp. GIB2]|nr:hypothetical protein DL765_004734 [Monosporascus sp. GIB2]
MADVYHRSGRGGAGNFYSRKDIEALEKRAPAGSKVCTPVSPQPPYSVAIPLDEPQPRTSPLTLLFSPLYLTDLEAQPPRDRALDLDPPPSDPADPPPPLTPSTTTAQQHAHGYARSGRGGAGNFVADVAAAVPTTAATAPTSRAGVGGLSGRGGAGNWVSAPSSGGDGAGAAGDEREEEEEKQRRRRSREALGLGGSGDARRDVDVEAGAALPRQPPRIYHMHGPGRGRVRGGPEV